MHAGPSQSHAAAQQKKEATRTNEQEASSSSLHLNEGDSSLILRIKRKRGTDPISALRIESLSANGAEAEVTGRLDPKREDTASEEPRKRRLTQRETVSAASFANPEAADQLERRLTEKKKVQARKGNVDEDKSPIVKPADARSQISHEAAALRFKIVKPINKNLSIKRNTGLQRKGSSGSLKDRVVYGSAGRTVSRSSPRVGSKGIDSPGRVGPSPLVNRVRFVDAVIDDLEAKKESTFEGKRGKAKHPSIRRKAVDSQGGDVEMSALDRRFADLLGSYLEENDLQPPSDLYDSVDNLPQQGDSSDEDADSDDEYVYDIYFREKESMWGSGPAGASDAGLRPAEVAGHEQTRIKAVEAGPVVAAEPMATLVGFTDEDDIISEMENATKQMAQEVPNDSSDEFDEGEDEDSNDEGFYRNDYPEDEDAEDEGETEQAGWGWSGPRKRREGRSSDEEASEEESEEY